MDLPSFLTRQSSRSTEPAWLQSFGYYLPGVVKGTGLRRCLPAAVCQRGDLVRKTVYGDTGTHLREGTEHATALWATSAAFDIPESRGIVLKTQNLGRELKELFGRSQPGSFVRGPLSVFDFQASSVRRGGNGNADVGLLDQSPEEKSCSFCVCRWLSGGGRLKAEALRSMNAGHRSMVASGAR
ncbi:hypothetical protein CVT26_005435 [Gymnopilus dilepis]|uniref:Uncharacterized protein n=1 Tax=Gymnopilus dilepis TaxID=231916 RepID=A0A409W8K6_9AGAR|nr:hypothetical protein CVT26_005435 [Gymnopilus dilepis]